MAAPLWFPGFARLGVPALVAEDCQTRNARHGGCVLTETELMKNFGLALSGGGFRACLYHLGVIRYLRDADLLSRVSHITSVSGGSVIAAHLALNWDRYNGSDAEFQDVSNELIRFLQLDVRNRIVRRFPLASLGNMVRRACRMGTLRQYTRAGLLERHYERFLYGDAGLFQLPDSPRLYILATDVNEGSICAFYRGGMLLQRRTASGKRQFEHFPVGLATVPMAVAASSAFPGFFPPLQLRSWEVGAKEGEFGQHAFTDGGIYDNIGLRMFHHLKHTPIVNRDGIDEGHLGDKQSLEGIFVSNAGATFKVRTDGRAGGILSTAMRSSDILMDRVNQLELESFHNSAGTLFFPITELIDQTEDPDAPHREIQRQASRIRTDMDRFSDLEISVLVQHGYCVARSVCRSNIPDKIGSDEQMPLWNPLQDLSPDSDSEDSLSSEAAALERGRELQRSSSRRIFSTLLSPRDWPTYFWVPLIAAVVLTMPIILYRSNETAIQRGYVITAVSGTSPVYRKILELIETGPVTEIPKVEFEEVTSLEPVSYDGIEVLSDNRIFDLRQWDAEHIGKQVPPYAYARLLVQRTADPPPGIDTDAADPASSGPEQSVRLQSVSSDDHLNVFCLSDSLSPRYLRKRQDDGTSVWEINLDFSHIPIGQDTEVVFEGNLISEYATQSADEGRFTFAITADTGMAQIWMLMPQDREYERFQISGYPIDRPDLLEIIEPTSKVELPVGSIATFQIINPKEAYRYECRWKWRPQ